MPENIIYNLSKSNLNEIFKKKTKKNGIIKARKTRREIIITRWNDFERGDWWSSGQTPTDVMCLSEMQSRTQGSRPRPRTQKKSEAKAKAKNSPSEDRPSLGQGQEYSRPRPRTQDRGASVLKQKQKNKGLQKNCSGDFQKIFFSGILQKKGYLKKSSDDLQTFSDSKTSFVLKRRTGQIFRTWSFEAKAKNFKMCPWGRPRGQGPVLGTASFF